MKGGNGDKYGTSFFIACLALVDILLRVNWLTLVILLVAEETYGSVLWCLGLIFVQAFLNLVIWRRFFKFKYNMDDNDLHFVQYCRKYPRTSRTIVFLSYYVTF